MNKNIKILIFRMLDKKGSSLFRYDINKNLRDFPVENINHVIETLIDDGLLKRTQTTLSAFMGPEYSDYVELTTKGYDFFKPWYKKILNFISEDMTKIFSLIAIIISILVGLRQLGVI